MSIQITSAKPNNTPEILRVFTLARSKMLYLPKLHTNEDTENFITKLVAGGNVLVAKVSGNIVGFIQYENGWINHLYVHPEFQGVGIGKRLLDEIKAMYPADMRLWVFEQNKDAIRFYEREGFVLEEKRDQQHADNEENLPDRRYVWAPKNNVSGKV